MAPTNGADPAPAIADSEARGIHPAGELDEHLIRPTSNQDQAARTARRIVAERIRFLCGIGFRRRRPTSRPFVASVFKIERLQLREVA